MTWEMIAKRKMILTTKELISFKEFKIEEAMGKNVGMYSDQETKGGKILE